MENVKYECEAILILSPNNAPFKQKLDEVNKLLGSAAGEAAKFFTSDFHKQHLNTIVWSTKPLVVGKESEMTASIKTDFKTGDYIYGTAYLGINAKDAMNGNSDLRVRIRVDGATAIWEAICLILNCRLQCRVNRTFSLHYCQMHNGLKIIMRPILLKKTGPSLI